MLSDIETLKELICDLEDEVEAGNDEEALTTINVISGIVACLSFQLNEIERKKINGIKGDPA